MLKFEIPKYYKERRDQLLKDHPETSFIFAANRVPLRNSDVNYPFRQESNFYYLSGFEEPESFLVLSYNPQAPKKYRSTLFVQPRDTKMELWEGERYGKDRVQSIFFVDETKENHEFLSLLPELLKDSKKIYHLLGNDLEVDQGLIDALIAIRKKKGRSGTGLLPIYDPTPIIGEMRLVKSDAEVQVIGKACDATSKAHAIAMKTIRPGMNESEIEALLEYEFKKGGCQRIGYESIIAGGRNACCLHYTANNEPLKDGDLVLIDAGGEFDYYTADVTRTFPVGNKFSTEQKAIYEIVLEANKQAISIVKPGLAYEKIHEKAQQVIAEGLKKIGLLDGSIEEIIKDKNKLFRYFPHLTGHFLGMDVHDVGVYRPAGKSRVLKSGMVFTIEPGIYCQPTDSKCPDSYKGIGIRIEDNILVTSGGYRVLTSEAPKEIKEIEDLK